MNAADKIINNKQPKKLIAAFLIMFLISAAGSFWVAGKIADITAERQIESYLSAAGGGGIANVPTDEILAEGEELVSRYGISRNMSAHLVFDYKKTRRTAFFTIFGVSFAAMTIWLIISLKSLFRMYDKLERLRQDCIDTANSMSGRVRLQGSANDCIRRVSEGADLMANRMDFLSRSLERDKTYLSEFLGDFSHQIKNALAVVRLNTDILAESESLTVERRNELNDELQLNLDDMELLVVQAIKLARLDADTIEYDMKRTPVANVCERAIKRITPMLREKRIMLNRILPGDICLECDRSWLCEAVENIMKNSADHSGCTEISLELEEDPAMIKLILSDNGVGIPQGDIPKIFERFAKKSSDITMKSAGLGLSIALKIIRQHGGEILVYSEIGSGTRFEIVFIKA